MSPSDAGEAFIEDLLEESENPGDDDEKSISREDDFVDDDASQFSTQMIASVQENNINGRGARQPGNEDDEFAEAEGHENRYFGGVSGATLPSIAITHGPHQSSLRASTRAPPRSAEAVTYLTNAEASNRDARRPLFTKIGVMAQCWARHHPPSPAPPDHTNHLRGRPRLLPRATLMQSAP